MANGEVSFQNSINGFVVLVVFGFGISTIGGDITPMVAAPGPRT
jgi:hypothetical protein